MLDKKSKRMLMIIGAVLLIMVLSEVFRPRPINWRPSYTSVETIPFGSYVLFEELSSLFGEAKIEKVNRDPYEFLLDSTYQANSVYFFLNDNLFMDDRQVDALMEYVSHGNTAFLSANSFGYILQDTLGIYPETEYDLLEESIYPSLFNPRFQLDSLPPFKRSVYRTILTDIDTLETTALGYYKDEEEPLSALNYVSIAHGDGQFLIHTLPQAFSNFYMLKGNEKYTAQVLSYMDPEAIYWDSYIKSGRKVVTSPMRFVLAQDALRWFYYVTMGGLLLLVLFKAKREQRIIEVVEPLKNTSVEFTQTIGDLYFQHKDYSNIISKKITYFLETIRSHYFLDTQDLDENFAHKLALKSGNNETETLQLIRYINRMKSKVIHTENDLVQLNQKMQEFKI